MSNLNRFGFLLFLSCFLSLKGVFAQEIKGIPVTVDKGITVSVEDLIKMSNEADKNPRIKKLRKELEARRRPKENPAAPMVPSWPVPTGNGFPNAAKPDNTNRVNATQSIYSNFLAITLAQASSVPPDSNGDVGPTQICIPTNGRLKFFPKNTVCTGQQTTTVGSSSTTLAGATVDLDLDAFFTPVAGAFGVSDPHVRYDRLSQRWFIAAIDLRAAPNRCVLAVSSGPTIVNAASFTFFFFVFDALTPVPPAPYAGGFFDYPTLGVDANALYIGGRMFNGALNAYTGASVFVVRKSSVLAAGPMVVTPFHQLGTAAAGIYTPQGVHNDDPAATAGYIIGVDQAVFSQLDIHRISTPGGTPTASAMLPLTVPATSSPLNPVASGDLQSLDANDDRLFAAMIKKNRATGVSTLWTSHAIAVNTAGAGANSGVGRRNGLRWYQIGNLSAAPSITQSGTVFDNAAATPRFYWFPSIGTSGQGHSVIASSTCATNQFVDVAVAGRYSDDALGTMQTPVLATASTSVYAPPSDPGPSRRWGDYSQTVVDPDDDMTMWTFQEYTNNTNSWGVRAVQLAAPPPATPSLATGVGCGTPSGLNRVSNITINGTSASNSGFFDPGADAGGPGFVRRLAVTSTGGVAVSNVTFVSATQITATLTWLTSTGGSSRTLTITNPDCQSVTLNYTLPSGCSSLPVRYITFNAKDIGKRIALNWETSFEENNDYFEVQRRGADGNYYTIQTVTGKNNLTGAGYDAMDAAPLSDNYYRLKQVNKDFSFQYSDIVYVKLSSLKKLGIYPNPAQQKITVESPQEFTGGTVRIINISGTVVKSERIKELFQTIDINGLVAGAYIVEIRSTSGQAQRTKLTIEKPQP
jgi:Secretion system C-terminal sorting domain